MSTSCDFATSALNVRAIRVHKPIDPQTPSGFSVPFCACLLPFLLRPESDRPTYVRTRFAETMSKRPTNGRYMRSDRFNCPSPTVPLKHAARVVRDLPEVVHRQRLSQEPHSCASQVASELATIVSSMCTLRIIVIRGELSFSLNRNVLGPPRN